MSLNLKLQSSASKNQARNIELAKADQAVAAGRVAKDVERDRKMAAKNTQLDQVTPLLVVDFLRSNWRKINNDELDLQLDWHRRIEGGAKATQVPVKSKISKKADKAEALCAAVQRYWGRASKGKGRAVDNAVSQLPDPQSMNAEASNVN